jgi:hypothetical protein
MFPRDCDCDCDSATLARFFFTHAHILDQLIVRRIESVETHPAGILVNSLLMLMETLFQRLLNFI